ncbi:MAG: FG-GAP repeat domain-containing protein [Cytophagales bacterium]
MIVTSPCRIGKNIYNGTGTIAAGPERPYLIVESDKPVSVFNTNFNDNWMTYLGMAQSQDFSLKTNMPPYAVIPGDTSSIVTQVIVQTQSPINNASASMQVEGNVQVISSVFNSPSGTVQHAAISDDSKTATFTNLPAIPSSQTYSFTTSVIATVSNNQGNLFIGNSVGTITAQVTGTVDGVTLQAVSSEGIFINSSDQSQLLFSKSTDSAWDNLLTDSWTVSLVDYNNDNWDDIFISDRDKTKSNHLFRNNGNKTFTKITSGDVVTDAAISI